MAGKGLFTRIAGAAVGAAVGLLYAPQSGEETRKKLKLKNIMLLKYTPTKIIPPTPLKGIKKLKNYLK